MGPEVGLWVLDCVILPLIFLVLITRYRELRLPYFLYLLLFVIGFLMFPLLIPRKHVEMRLAQWVPSFWFLLGVVQMHNNIYEELGKLLALLIPLWVFKDYLKPLFLKPRSAILMGFWTGLGYGIGEAVTLTVIAYKPEIGKVAGVSLMWLFITWNWVLERALAILIHGVMGGFVGLSLYFILVRKYWRALGFFIIALFFHELVDGTVLFVLYHGANPIAQIIKNNLLCVVLPLYVLLGLVALLVTFLLKKNSDALSISGRMTEE